MAVQMNKANSAWTPRPSKPGVKDFEKYYVNYEIKDVVKKVGEGEDDYVLEKKKIIHKDLIKGVIDSHSDEVGVYKLIERAMLTGDYSLLKGAQAHVSDSVLDITGSPTDLADGLHQRVAQEQAYAALPASLTKGRTLEQFINTITQEEFDAFIKGLVPEKKGDNE